MSRAVRMSKHKSKDNRREALMLQVRKKERKQHAQADQAPLDKLFKLAAMHTAATTRILLKLHKYAREAALEEAAETGGRVKRDKRAKRRYADDEAEEDSAYDDGDSADEDMEDDYDSLDAPSAYSLHSDDSNMEDDEDDLSRDYDNEHYDEDSANYERYASAKDRRGHKRKRRANMQDSESSDREVSDDERREKKRAKQAGGQRTLANNASTFGFGPEHGAALTFDAAETISFGQGTGVRPSSGSVQIDARSGREIVASQVADPFGLFAQHPQQQAVAAAPQYATPTAASRTNEVNLFASAPVPMSASQLMRNEAPQATAPQQIQQSQGARSISAGLPLGFMQPPPQAPVANVASAATTMQAPPTIAVVTDAAPTTVAVSTHTTANNASAPNSAHGHKATAGTTAGKPRKSSNSTATPANTVSSTKRADKKSAQSSSNTSAELPMISVRLDDATL